MWVHEKYRMRCRGRTANVPFAAGGTGTATGAALQITAKTLLWPHDWLDPITLHFQSYIAPAPRAPSDFRRSQCDSMALVLCGAVRVVLFDHSLNPCTKDSRGLCSQPWGFGLPACPDLAERTAKVLDLGAAYCDFVPMTCRTILVLGGCPYLTCCELRLLLIS